MTKHHKNVDFIHEEEGDKYQGGHSKRSRKHRKMSMAEWEKSPEDKKKDKEELAEYNKTHQKHMKHRKMACKTCGKMSCKHMKHYKGHAPKGAHGRAAVHELGRTKTTGNFKKIEAAHGKGAAIAAFQNAKAAHEGKAAPFHRKHYKYSGKTLLKRVMGSMK